MQKFNDVVQASKVVNENMQMLFPKMPRAHFESFEKFFSLGTYVFIGRAFVAGMAAYFDTVYCLSKNSESDMDNVVLETRIKSMGLGKMPAHYLSQSKGSLLTEEAIELLSKLLVKVATAREGISSKHQVERMVILSSIMSTLTQVGNDLHVHSLLETSDSVEFFLGFTEQAHELDSKTSHESRKHFGDSNSCQEFYFKYYKSTYESLAD